MTDDLFEPINVIENITSTAMIRQAEADNPTFSEAFVWLAIKQDLRDKVNAKWQLAIPFSENNFITEFKIKENFYARFWELNLRSIFVNKLDRKPGDGEPDLISDAYVIEAVVPDTTDDVPVVQYNGQEFSYPTDQIGRRVTAALAAKHAQLQRRKGSESSRIQYTTTPYIIAVGLPQRDFMSARSMSGLDIPESILMGAGPVTISLDENFQQVGSDIAPMYSMHSRSGAEYDVAYFQRDDWKDVSAVIWSSELMPEKGDISLLFNPNATLPLTPEDIGIEGLNYISYTRTETGFSRDQPLS